jgi:hypothetical protein
MQVLKKWPKLSVNSWVYLLIPELYFTLIIDIDTSITASELIHFIFFCFIFYE